MKVQQNMCLGSKYLRAFVCGSGREVSVYLKTPKWHSHLFLLGTKATAVSQPPPLVLASFDARCTAAALSPCPSERPPLLHEGSCFLLAPAQLRQQPRAAHGVPLLCLFSSLPPSVLLGAVSQLLLVIALSVALFLVHW